MSAALSLLHPCYGLLLLLAFVVYKQRKSWYFIWQLNGCRGIIQQPILWILLIFYVDPKSIMTSINRFGKYFKFPLAVIVFNRTLLYVDDPLTMEGILTAPECLNKTFMQNGFFANKGLLHAKDEQWKIRRKQLNPAFNHNTLISFLGDFNRVANELAQQLKPHLQDNIISFHQLDDLVSRAVLEVSCLTTMGVSTHFTQNDEKGIAWAYRYLMELTALKILKPWYQIDSVFRLLDRENYEIWLKAKKLAHEFVTNIVQQKHAEWKQKQQHSIVNTVGDGENHTTPTTENITEQRIFIDQIFHLAQMGKLSLQDVMDESQSMVVVSFETVSTCIINALLCLALNHDCQVKLRQEIRRIMAKDPKRTLSKQCADDTAGPQVVTASQNYDHDDDNHHVTMAHLQDMPYLDMILNESLRLLTTVPMNLRNVSRDFQLNILERQRNKRTISSGSNHPDYGCRTKLVTVPKDTMIAVDTFNMQRSTEFWGPAALNFIPERFSKEPQTEDSEPIRRHSYAFVPFSKGLRTCIGYRYSIYLSKIILIKLISTFDFTTNVQFEDLEYYESVSLKYRNSKDIHFEIHQVAEEGEV